MLSFSKKWFAIPALITTLFFSSASVGGAQEGLPRQTSLSFDLDNDQTEDFELRLEGWAAAVEPEIETTRHAHATYHHYRYMQEGNYFRLTIMHASNGDVLYTARNYTSATPNEVQLSVIAYDPEPIARRFVPAGEPTWDEATQTRLPGHPPRWEQLERFPAITRDTLYLDSERLHYRIGQADVFQPLGYSVFQELPEKRATMTIARNDESVVYTVPLKADATIFSDTWGLLATQPLIRWEHPNAMREASQLELQHDKKLSVDGAYYATPSNYRPTAKNAFYLNPANVIGLRMVPLMNASDMYGTLFEDVATHLAYASIKRQTADGYWPTAPRSLWLSGDYRIEHNYMDNRRNADNVTFLLRFMKAKEDPHIEAALQRWDGYQLSYMEKYAVPTPNGGVLLPDYVGDDQSLTSHISLNHHLSNLMYLLESYPLDENPLKLAWADKLLKGVEDTAMLWIMPDHNLYYALTPALVPYKPDQYPDYHSLTRDDLEVTQWLLTKIGRERNPKLQMLIDQKNLWISQQ